MTKKATLLAATSVLALSLADPAGAVVYFQEDFDANNGEPFNNDTIDAGTWRLPPAHDNSYGEGNFFLVSDATSYTGNYSLKIDYNGRNSVCNTCGRSGEDHIDNLDGVDYFVSTDGKNLAGPPFNAEPGRFAFNTDDGEARWQITGVVNENAVNDRLNLVNINPGYTGNLPPVINGGDRIAIAKQCGVDGNISAGNTERRSDCNAVIDWFSFIDFPTPPDGSGGSIFRRQYMKHEIASTGIRQKLFYYRPRSVGEIVLFADNKQTPEPRIELAIKDPDRNGFNAGTVITKRDDLQFERGKWYYVQIEYRPETTTGASDGAIRVWFSEAGSEPPQGSPSIEYTGMDLPPLDESNDRNTHISLWGNQQHNVHSVGAWYIDALVISDQFNPPVPYTGQDAAPGGPPAAP